MEGYYHITAIVNTHNTPKVSLVDRALASVAAQEGVEVPWEVIVVNDGPICDELQPIFDKYVDVFEKLGVEYNVMGVGERPSEYQCRPKNYGIYSARGEYISFLDYDNEWTPNHLRVLYDAMVEGDVWPDFAYGRRQYVVDEGCEEEMTLPGGKKIKLKEWVSPFIPWEEPYISNLHGSAMNNFVDSSDFMVSRGALWRAQMATGWMWNEGYRRFGDYELIARATGLAGWRGKGVDEVVQIYHYHGDNVSLTRATVETPEKAALEGSDGR